MIILSHTIVEIRGGECSGYRILWLRHRLHTKLQPYHCVGFLFAQTKYYPIIKGVVSLL